MTALRRKTVAFSVGTLLTSGLLVGCGPEETVVQEAEEDGEVTEEMLVGETVTLQTEVTDVIGPNSFTVGEDDTLVVGAELALLLEEGQEVQVSGTVVEFVIVDVEEEWGIDFDDDEEELVLQWEEELAVASDDVEVLP